MEPEDKEKSTSSNKDDKEKETDKVKGEHHEKPEGGEGKPSKLGSVLKESLMHPANSPSAEMLHKQQEYQRYR